MTNKHLSFCARPAYWLATSLMVSAMLLPTASAAGKRDKALEPGWSGTMGLLVGRTDSQGLSLVDVDENQLIGRLDETPEEYGAAFALPTWELNYTLDNRLTRLHFGASERDFIEGVYFIEVGVSHKLSGGEIIKLSYLPEIPDFAKAWSDPYLTGAEREESEVLTEAATLSFDQLLSGLASVRLGYGEINVEGDQAGQSLFDAGQLSSDDLTLLKRDGYIKHADASMVMPLAKTVFARLALGYNERFSEGDANEYESTEVSLALIWRQPTFITTANVNIKHREYDVENPVFGLVQDDEEIKYTLLSRFPGAFGMRKANLMLLASYKENDSNIDFYDAEAVTIGGGLEYQF